MRGSLLRGLVHLLVVAAGLWAARDALAWGDEGHRIVAAIAYQRLAPAVRKTVDTMLAADPDTLTAPDFASRATWADRYRDADRSGSREHYLGTRRWHFVDIEIDDGDLDAACNRHPALPPGTKASAGPPDACVVDKIAQFAAELGSPRVSRLEKLLALKFLMHFVGDLHQPLHAADRHDRGGNAVPALYGDRTEPDNLHTYWDVHLVEALGSNAEAVAATLDRSITAADARRWAAGRPAHWALESFENARRVAYDFNGEAARAIEPGKSIVMLDAAYDARALPVVREQLSKAGVRLAAMLDAALRKSPSAPQH